MSSTKGSKPSKAPTQEMLVYASRLSEKEKVSAFSTGRILGVPQVSDMLKICTTEVIGQRMVLAEGLLDVAKRMMDTKGQLPSDEASLRCIVSRSYYSVYHSIRAAAMHANGFDPDGHDETVIALRRLLTENSFRSKSKLPGDADKKVEEAKANRGVADYSPYGLSRYPGGEVYISITGGTWGAAAKFNVDLADQFHVGCMRYVGLK